MLARDHNEHSNGVRPLSEKKVTSLVLTLAQRVEKFERRYEMTTTLMRSAVQDGRMNETADVSNRLQDAAVLDRIQNNRENDTAGTR
jgi:hypothetical protein